MTTKKKFIGYCINSKLRCLKVYVKEKKGRKVRVLYNNKKLRKGKKVFKTKTDCKKRILKLKQKKDKKDKRKRQNKAKKVTKTTKFGKSKCYYETPYFGGFVPTVGKYWSGTPETGISSANWMWPAPPGARAYDTQQGGWNKYKLA